MTVRDTSPQARARRLREALARRKHRKLYGLAAAVGVSPSSVSRWAKGEPIRFEHAVRLCEVLEISLDWLMLGRGDIDGPGGPTLAEVEQRLLALCRTAPPHVVRRVVDLLEAIGVDAPTSGRGPGFSEPQLITPISRSRGTILRWSKYGEYAIGRS